MTLTHTCALMYNGSVACTGENGKGQLGTGKAGGTAASFTLATALAGVNVISVAVGPDFTCVLADASQGNKVYCFGTNTNGELGNGSKNNSAVPVLVRGLGQSQPIVQLVVSSDLACVLYAAPGSNSSVQF